MKLRTRHLVCMILLLSALRAADGAVLPSGQNGYDAHYISALLSQNGTPVWTKVALKNLNSHRGQFIAAQRITGNVGDILQLGLPVAALASYRTIWTMRPPAAQCVALHCVTGFGFRTPTPASSL